MNIIIREIVAFWRCIKMWKSFSLWKNHKKIKRDMKEVSIDEIDLKDYFVIDVRSKKEYQEGHLNGAINIPSFSIKRNIDKINTNKKILVYCQSGIRSKKTLKILEELGIKNVYNLKGGLENT